MTKAVKNMTSRNLIKSREPRRRAAANSGGQRTSSKERERVKESERWLENEKSVSVFNGCNL